MLVPARDMVDAYDPLRPVADDIDDTEPWGITESRGVGDARAAPSLCLTASIEVDPSGVAIGVSSTGEDRARLLFAEPYCCVSSSGERRTLEASSMAKSISSVLCSVLLGV